MAFRSTTPSTALTASDVKRSRRNKIQYFLGKWCFSEVLVGKEGAARNAITQAYHWNDNKKLSRDVKYLAGLQAYLEQLIAYELNAIQKTSFEVEFWRILLGPWLTVYLISIFDRWEILQDFSPQVSVDQRFQEKKKLTLIPFDRSHANNLYSTDVWNRALLREIISFKSLAEPTVDHASKDKRPSRTKYQSYQIKPHELTLLQKLKARVAHYFLFLAGVFDKGVLIEAGFRPLAALRVGKPPENFWAQITRTAKVDLVNERTTNFDVLARSKIFDISYDSNYRDFERFLGRRLITEIPWVYLEGFLHLREISNSLPWPRDASYAITSYAHDSNEFFKFWVATQKSQNENFRLIVSQHAWGYFLFSPDVLRDHEYRVCDTFLSWGEMGSQYPKCKTLPSGKMISTFSRKKRVVQEGILFCLMSAPLYTYIIRSHPVGPQCYDLVISYLQFLHGLDQKTLKQVSVRPYPVEYTVEASLAIKKYFNGIHFDSSSSLERAVQDKKLVICDAYSSVWAECLLMDIPIIAVMDENIFRIDDRYKEDIANLIEVGLLFKSYEAAANFVINNDHNIEVWWELPEVQKQRVHFLNMFCQINEKWSNDWNEFLNGFVKSPKRKSRVRARS